MGKYDKAPVVDFDRLEEIKSNPDILPKDAIRMRKEAEAEGRTVEIKPKPTPFRPGDRYKTTMYAGYEGTELEIVVGTANSGGYIRYTIFLPEMPPVPPTRKAECPHCQIPFVGAELIYPGRPKRENQTIDNTTTVEDFTELLQWCKAEKM